MGKIVLESRMLRQDREERGDHVIRLATIKCKIDNEPVNSITNPLFAQSSKDQYHYTQPKPVSNISNPFLTQSFQDQRKNTHKSHFKMEIP